VNTLGHEGSEPARYAFNAALDVGGSLRGEGSLTLQPRLHSSGTLQLADIVLAELWPLLRRVVGMSFAPPAQQLAISARYEFTARDGTPDLQIQQADFHLRQVVLQPAAGETALLRLDTLAGSGGQLRLAARELSLATLQLRRGSLSLALDEQGSVDLLLPQSPAPTDPSDQGTAFDPLDALAGWRLRIETLRLDDVALHLADRGRRLALDAAALAAQARLQLAFGGGSVQLELDAIDARVDEPRLTMLQGDAQALPLLAFDRVSARGGALHSGQRRISAAQSVPRAAVPCLNWAANRARACCRH
jgi:hypothetical protein